MAAGNLGQRAVLVGVCVALAGCAGGSPRPAVRAPVIVPEAATAPEGSGVYKVGTPYQVEGIWYYPAEDYGYAQEGIASWYGADFHGKRTANGELYDMNDVSAAHPTLPLPSEVNVTNLDNGRQLKVRINDRGPFKSNRIIDLSRRAAQLLGFDMAGTAHVRVEIDAEESMRLKSVALRANPGEMPKIAAAPVERGVRSRRPADRRPASAPSLLPAAKSPPPKPVARSARRSRSRRKTLAGAPNGHQWRGHHSGASRRPRQGPIYVQAGAFADIGNAHRLEQQLKEFGNSFVLPVTVNNRQLFRVRLGPLADNDVAQAVLGRVRGYGYDDAQIVKY